MFNRNRAKTVQVTVEYYAPHWIVLIRNAGQADWFALRDPEIKISVQDEFGQEMKTRPAIKSFPHMGDAEAYINDHLKNAERVGKRDETAMKKFAAALNAPVNGLAAELQPS